MEVRQKKKKTISITTEQPTKKEFKRICPFLLYTFAIYHVRARAGFVAAADSRVND
jgi:hypothetical protein